MNYKNGGQVNITPPSSTTQQRSSDSLNTSDPIAMHLLVETALGDAKEFEILSFEELEELKREDTLLTQKMEAVRRKLALETKVRDAAKSLHRLYSAPKSSRRSISTDIKMKRNTADRTELELATSSRTCDELSRELYHLEQRSRVTQQRLFKHTAGILQMTYRQPKQRKYDFAFPPNGRPDSPASLDGFDRSFEDVAGEGLFRGPDNLDGFLDEMRLDRPRRRLSFRSSRDAAVQRKVLVDIGIKLDRLNQNVRDIITSTGSSKAAHYVDLPVPEFAPAGANIEGSINQQIDYLSQGLVDVLSEQDYIQRQLKTSSTQSQTNILELTDLQRHNAELQNELQSTIEKQTAKSNELSDLQRRNSSLQAELKSTMQGHVSKNSELTDLQQRHGDMQREMETTMQAHVAKSIELERRNAELQTELRGQASKGTEFADMQTRNAELQAELQAAVQEQMSVERDHQKITDMMTERLRQINAEFADVLESSGPEVPAVPAEEEGPAEQLEYTQDRVSSLKNVIADLMQTVQTARNRSNSNGDKAAQYEVVLEGLWEIILAGEEDTRQRKLAERRQRESNGANELNSDDEVSHDEDDGLTEVFSLPSFSTKVQWLVSKSTYLKEKEGNLRRRIQQQRHALENATGPRGQEAQRLRGDFERVSEQHGLAREELADLQKQMSQRDQEIEELKDDLENAAQEARDDARLASAEVQAKLQETQARADQLQANLNAASKDRQDAQNTLSQKDAALQSSQNELQGLESELVRLTTELTIAKAELDASYGSRQQRAADLAAASKTDATARLDEVVRRNAELEGQIAQLASERGAAGGAVGSASGREEQLRRELEATLAEFEELTRGSVEAEKERDNLEAEVDRLREQMEGLETQLYDEKVKWMGMKSPGPNGEGPAQSMGTLVLKNEFKKMMRDTRADHLRALRVCFICLPQVSTFKLTDSHSPSKTSAARSRASCATCAASRARANRASAKA